MNKKLELDRDLWLVTLSNIIMFWICINIVKSQYQKNYFSDFFQNQCIFAVLSKWDSPEFHRSKMDGQQPENNWVLLWETLSNCLWGPFVHPGHFYRLLQFLSRFSSRNFETQLRFHEIQNKQIAPSQMSTLKFVSLHQPLTKKQMWNTKFLCFDFLGT